MDIEILSLLKTIWEESPEVPFLEMIGSCFAEGDISHISDEELKENLVVLLELNRQQNKRAPKKRLELVTRVIDGDTASVKRHNPKIRQRVG